MAGPEPILYPTVPWPERTPAGRGREDGPAESKHSQQLLYEMHARRAAPAKLVRAQREPALDGISEDHTWRLEGGWLLGFTV